MPLVCKILVVDPDHAAVLQIASAFRQQEWTVVAAGDAVLAQSVVRKESPSAVVLSSQLPGGGALVVARRVRSSVHTVGVPVIVQGKVTGARGQEFLAAGASEYLAPPLDTAALCLTLRRYLGVEPAPIAASAAAAAPAPARAPVLAPADVIASPERMSALTAAQVLDTPPSKLMDAITRVATLLLGVPTALLSIVDKDRQFFKSQIGLPEPWSSQRQTPLSHSFCQWVASSTDELVVEDARELPGLASNLAIRDIGVIAYAGIPVSLDNGPVLGSFCAIDTKPVSWSLAQLANLRHLARMTEAAMTLERLSAAAANATRERAGDKAENMTTGAVRDQLQRSRATATVILNATRLLQHNLEANPAHPLLLEMIEEQSAEWTRT